MAARKRQAEDSGRDGRDRSVGGVRELIFVATTQSALRASAASIESDAGEDVNDIKAAVARASATVRPLFGMPESRQRANRARIAEASRADVPDLSVYYRVDAPDSALDNLCQELAACASVEAAYVKPASEPAVAVLEARTAPRTDDPPATPDLSSRQRYLGPTMAGIDAHFAWTVPGGRGAGVRITDIEGAWRFSHEDLRANQGGVVGGTPSADIAWRNHGTAVLGEYSGDHNGIGIAGICPDATATAVSIFGNGMGSANAIRLAADRLRAGDIILLELHRPGPRFGFASRADQRGYIAIEWWPDDFDAIRYATSRGILVVEAAGNGAEDLDDALYSQRPAGFPASWSNPFVRTANRDSGAIVVGAGAPPPGTHGRDHGPDRSRLDFSNYGALVDAQGWGREVTTCGYGDLQGGSSEDLWYTDRFSGTSSASPIVVGALGCLQGALRAANRPVLNFQTARAALRTTGAPQTDAPGRPATQRIGNRPDLRALIQRLVGTHTGGDTRQRSAVLQPLFRYWNRRSGDHFYTTNWNELGAGRSGYVLESIQAYLFQNREPGTVPLYRYWNARATDHFYTTNWDELRGGAHGWAYEGVQGYVFERPARGTAALHRYWNPSIADHFYTTNFNELGHGSGGWTYEGVQCQVVTEPSYVFEEAPPAAPEATDSESIPASFRTAVADVPYAIQARGVMPGRFSDAFDSMEELTVPDTFTTPPSLGNGNGSSGRDLKGHPPTTIHLNIG